MAAHAVTFTLNQYRPKSMIIPFESTDGSLAETCFTRDNKDRLVRRRKHPPSGVNIEYLGSSTCPRLGAWHQPRALYPECPKLGDYCSVALSRLPSFRTNASLVRTHAVLRTKAYTM